MAEHKPPKLDKEKVAQLSVELMQILEDEELPTIYNNLGSALALVALTLEQTYQVDLEASLNMLMRTARGASNEIRQIIPTVREH